MLVNFRVLGWGWRSHAACCSSGKMCSKLFSNKQKIFQGIFGARSILSPGNGLCQIWAQKDLQAEVGGMPGWNLLPTLCGLSATSSIFQPWA